MSQQDELKTAIQAGIQDAVKRPHFYAGDDCPAYYPAVYEDSLGQPVIQTSSALRDYVDPFELVCAIADALNAACAAEPATTATAQTPDQQAQQRIAAAGPELYAACKEVSAWVTMYPRGTETFPRSSLFDAIWKAEGREP